MPESWQIAFPTSYLATSDGTLSFKIHVRVVGYLGTEIVLEADIFDREEIIVQTVDYAYDIYNRLVRRTLDDDGPLGENDPTDTFFSWENGQIVFQFDGAASAEPSHRYLWNPVAIDQILADENALNEVLWPLTDHLGTPRDIAQHDNTTGDTTIVNHRLYDSFGRLISESDDGYSVAFGFTGVYFDIATGLNYHRARWYDPSVGKWISEDPISFAAGDTNLQRYVGNNPITSRNPSGLIDPNHGDFNSFLNGWGVGQYLSIHHVFRQEFYDSDPEIGPYLTGHGFAKDDCRNLMPLPNRNAFNSGYTGNRAAHLGRHTSSSTGLLQELILQIKRRENAGDIGAEQARQLLTDLQRQERLRLRTTPDALQNSATVQECQAGAIQARPKVFAQRPKGILRLPSFQMPRMPNLRMPQVLNGPVAREYGPMIGISLGQGLLTDIDENYLDHKLTNFMNDSVDPFLYTYTIGLLGNPHSVPPDQQWGWHNWLR